MPKRKTKKQKFERFYKGFKALQETGDIKKKDLVMTEKVISRYPSSDSEHKVVDDIKKKLNHYNIDHVRRTVGVFYTRAGGRVSVGETGEADIEIFDLPVPYCGIEAKAGKGGKLSEDQVKFRNRIERLGGIYITACSDTEAIEKFLECKKELKK